MRYVRTKRFKKAATRLPCKFVVNGKPVKKGGQTYDYKMMLAEYVRLHATPEDLSGFTELLRKARKCMGIKG